MRKSDSLATADGPEASLPLLETEYRDPRDLVDYDQNSRTHTPEQIEGIAAAIQRFGFNAQILLKDDGSTIGAGHARRAAACLLIERGVPIPRSPDGIKVPTAVLRGLTEVEWKAYVIADNQLALTAGWDEDILQAELRAILDAEPDLGSVVGFDQDEMDRILGVAAETPPTLNGGGSFSYQEQFGVIVVCTDEASQKAAFEALTESGYDCRVVVT